MHFDDCKNFHLADDPNRQVWPNVMKTLTRQIASVNWRWCWKIQYVTKLSNCCIYHLFSFGKVCHVAKVVNASHVEPSTSSLAAEPRDNTRFRLSLWYVDCTYLHSATRHFQQPLITVNVVPLQMQVERSIPAIHNSQFSSHYQHPLHRMATSSLNNWNKLEKEISYTIRMDPFWNLW